MKTNQNTDTPPDKRPELPTPYELAALAATLAKDAKAADKNGAWELVNAAARIWDKSQRFLENWEAIKREHPEPVAQYEGLGWDHEWEVERHRLDTIEWEPMTDADREASPDWFALQGEGALKLLAFFRDGETIPTKDRFKTWTRLKRELGNWPKFKNVQEGGHKEFIHKRFIEEFLSWRKKNRADAKQVNRYGF